MIDTLLAAVAIVVAMAGACAAPRSSGPLSPQPSSAVTSAVTPADSGLIADIQKKIGDRESALATQTAAAAPACAQACALENEICALAERICTITARYPVDDPVSRLCLDGRARCRRALEAVRARCACPTS
jgi:hypothetical protein